eukprot:2174335-Rhodomonas_salina.1
MDALALCVSTSIRAFSYRHSRTSVPVSVQHVQPSTGVVQNKRGAIKGIKTPFWYKVYDLSLIHISEPTRPRLI